MKYWKVEFSTDGAVIAVTEVPNSQQDDWVIVSAPDIETAKRKAFSIYCARKKKLAKTRHHAKGECGCGRPQDRFFASGKRMLVCSVCDLRGKGYKANALVREAAGIAPGTHVRDEKARIEANLVRQRDRRGEIRLETLIEVEKQWINSRNLRLFEKWLHGEIAKYTDKAAE